jgi:hypothetical protein
MRGQAKRMITYRPDLAGDLGPSVEIPESQVQGTAYGAHHGKDAQSRQRTRELEANVLMLDLLWVWNGVHSAL